MSQQPARDTYVRGKKRVAYEPVAATASTSVDTPVGKQKVYPVKIYELPDAIKIGDFGHMFARVRFWRNRPFVDIRRYTQDTTRPSFYTPDGNNLFLSQRQFNSLVENAEQINGLLSQYGGLSAKVADPDDNATAEPTETRTSPPLAKAMRPTYHRQNAITEDTEAEEEGCEDLLQAVVKQLNEKTVAGH